MKSDPDFINSGKIHCPDFIKSGQDFIKSGPDFIKSGPEFLKRGGEKSVPDFIKWGFYIFCVTI
jgi:hypothetical protein